MANANAAIHGLFHNNTWNHQPEADRLNQIVFDGSDKLKEAFAKRDAVNDMASNEWKEFDREAMKIMAEGDRAMQKLNRLPLGAEHFTPKN